MKKNRNFGLGINNQLDALRNLDIYNSKSYAGNNNSVTKDDLLKALRKSRN
ncbi:hypothetical protein [Chondrinema litorale]|uniref:hypothetical protein n=1 Tax=Chondrinema litorale TaxID=2994555 RepID=UPI002542ADCA|nr:hypothetical protein [Chondrinema litorale]UZR98276.1 hypothetical protein OQ292_31065 [Chondrinema litorale]